MRHNASVSVENKFGETPLDKANSSLSKDLQGGGGRGWGEGWVGEIGGKLGWVGEIGVSWGEGESWGTGEEMS